MDEIRRVELKDRCPACGGQLGAASIRTRTVAEIEPVKIKRICYELERRIFVEHRASVRLECGDGDRGFASVGADFLSGAETVKRRVSSGSSAARG